MDMTCHVMISRATTENLWKNFVDNLLKFETFMPFAEYKVLLHQLNLMRWRLTSLNDWLFAYETTFTRNYLVINHLLPVHPFIDHGIRTDRWRPAFPGQVSCNGFIGTVTFWKDKDLPQPCKEWTHCWPYWWYNNDRDIWCDWQQMPEWGLQQS